MYDDIFEKLAKSDFRSRFKLKEKDKKYLEEKGFEVIKSHARDFIKKRIAPAEIKNDGKQTPMRGHPIFKAQHATACCCRGCLYKWHQIPQGRSLSTQEQDYIVDILMQWLELQTKQLSAPQKQNSSSVF